MMIVLIAKLSLVIGLLIVTAIVWQKTNRATWSSFLFGLLAYGIHFLVRLPLEQLFPRLFDPLEGALFFWHGLWPSWIIQFFLFGLFREGVRWLTFRHIATSVQSWRDGVIFGIGYSTLATLMNLSENIASLFEDSPSAPIPFIERATVINDVFSWENTIAWICIQGITLMVFNAGTCLAVLFSVQRRQVWPLLTAVVFYVIRSSTTLVVFLYFDDVQVGGLDPQMSLTTLIVLAHVIAVLPPLWLIFRLRKPLYESEFR